MAKNEISECSLVEESEKDADSIFPNVPMKCSFSVPPSEITPMKSICKDSALKSSVRKSSVKCCRNLFESANKRSDLITSFVDEESAKR